MAEMDPVASRRLLVWFLAKLVVVSESLALLCVLSGIWVSNLRDAGVWPLTGSDDRFELFLLMT